MPKREDAYKKSLRYSVWDGSFYSAMVSFGISFFSAFAVFLRATANEVAIIGSLPQALGSLFQLYATKLLRFVDSRKRFIILGASAEVFMYVPIILVYFLGTFKIPYLIAFVSLYYIFSMMINPVWSSWMGDLVPEKRRGSYFGMRNKITGLVSFITFLLAGYLLQQFSSSNSHQYLGFVLLFILAIVSRIASIYFLSLKFEPEFKIDEKAQFSFAAFLKHARQTNFGLFTLYMGFMNLAVYIASPFITAYMLSDLHMSYWTYTLITAASLIVKFLAMPVWGRIADRYGSIHVLTVSGFLIPIVPLLWVFSADFWYLMAIQVFSGFVWAGFEIASFDFIFDSTSKEKRVTCVAYYNLVTGVMLFAGALIGALAMKYNIFSWSGYVVIFALSFFARYLVSFLFLPRLREIRHVRRITYHELLMKAIFTMPSMGLIQNVVVFATHEIDHLKEKVKIRKSTRDYFQREWYRR